MCLGPVGGVWVRGTWTSLWVRTVQSRSPASACAGCFLILAHAGGGGARWGPCRTARMRRSTGALGACSSLCWPLMCLGPFRLDTHIRVVRYKFLYYNHPCHYVSMYSVMYLCNFVLVLSLVSFFSCLMTGNPCFELKIIQKCNNSETLMPRKSRIGFPTFVVSLINNT